MISMTGFGKGVRDIKTVHYSVELSSVNHKFFDVNFRMPGSLMEHQNKLKEALKKKIGRGHLEVNIFVWEGREHKEIAVNTALAKKYLDSLKKLQTKLGLKGPVSLDQVLRYNDVIKVYDKKESSWPGVKEAFDLALKNLAHSRKLEGEKITKDIMGRISNLGKMLDSIVKINTRVIPESKRKAEERLRNIFKNVEKLDESRICAEASLTVERSDISEEISRLKGHITEFKRIVADGTPAGRKLDFLVQEFLREINTVGSKCSTNEISHTVVAFKEELERVREQVQNVE